MEQLKVFKIGGRVVENEKNLNFFLENYAKIPGKKLLVHGGGNWVTEMSERLGLETKKIDGRRITDAETLKVVLMMLAGLANKTIVSKLQAFGCNALGLTGADGNVIESEKRPLKNGIDYGFVGDVKKVNGLALQKLIDGGFSPVLTALTHDKKGTLLNTNADTIASVTAVSLAPTFDVELIFCFELPGVLKDINDQKSVIPLINSDIYKELRASHVINEGMIPKIDNAFDALQEGVKKVRICHSEHIVKFAEGKTNFGTLISN